ncbi:MAG: hypothetical protein IKU19_05580 [Clostridia bacterium]|nr:hypothetical protein [Clostridia bacterium]
MGKYTEDAYITCPFYLKEASTRLICEGITEGASNVTVFGNSLLKARHQSRYCRRDYGSCALCKALMSKYD